MRAFTAVLSLTLTAALWLCAASTAPAQCPSWGPGFGPPDVHGIVDDQIVFDDGSGPALYIGGGFDSAGGVAVTNVARWDGTTWSAVGAGLPFAVGCFAVFDDGSGPALHAATAYDVFKWNGSTWSSLGTGFVNIGEIATYDDGSGPRLYVSGWFSSLGGVSASNIARWDGAAWSSVGGGLDHEGRALAVYDDGSGPALYVSGLFSNAGGVSANRIARWDGTSWSALGSGVNTNVYCFAVHDDGSGPALFAGGTFTSAGGVPVNNVAKWNGTTWSALGTGVVGGVLDMVVADDGTGTALYLGGVITSAGGVPASRVAKWNGSTYSPLGAGVDGGVYSLAAFDDGSGTALYVAGDFTTAGTGKAHSLAKWRSPAWSRVSEESHGLDGQVIALCAFDDGTGPAVYAGGTFTQAGDAAANYVAKWDGTEWSPLGSGMNDQVTALAVFDDGSGPALYAGGAFTTAGGVPANAIAKWDGSAWSALGAGIQSGTELGFVYALAVFDGGSGPMLYVGGNFNFAGGQELGGHIVRWDGSRWLQVATGANQPVTVLATLDDGSGPKLYAGGYFTSIGGVGGTRIAKWNGTSWSTLGTGMNNIVYAIEQFDDGGGPAIYAGGSFTNAGGVNCNQLARWNGSAWSPVGGGVAGGLPVGVLSLCAHDDGEGPALFVGGQFDSVGGVPSKDIAKWDGSAWSTMGEVISNDIPEASRVNDLAVFEGGAGAPKLFAGGWFQSAGGLPSYHLATWVGCEVVGIPICPGDGSANACPCSNSGLPGRGCQNSAGTGGASLVASGTVSPDTIVLHASGELPTALTIFLQGNTINSSGLAFGDGLRCATGILKRLYVKSASGGAVAAPASGDPSITERAAELGHPILPGARRYYQTYYRDANPGFCPMPQGNTFNASSGVKINW